MSILATPFGSVNSNGTPSLYAGQPISTEVKISTSFRWGPNRDDQNQSFMMRYNVEETIRDWLISGPKRGEFIAKVCNIDCLLTNQLEFVLGKRFIYDSDNLVGIASRRIAFTQDQRFRTSCCR